MTVTWGVTAGGPLPLQCHNSTRHPHDPRAATRREGAAGPAGSMPSRSQSASRSASSRSRGVWLVEYLGDPCGGVGPTWGARVRLEPVGGSGIGDVAELGDEHGEVLPAAHCSWPTGAKVPADHVAGPARIGRANSNSTHPSSWLRVGRATVLPVDDTDSTIGCPQDVVGPQVLVAGPHTLRRLDPGLQRDQLLGRPGGGDLSDIGARRVAPAVGVIWLAKHGP